MSNDEQILATLQKILEVQERMLAVQQQQRDLDQQAIANLEARFEKQSASQLSRGVYRAGVLILTFVVVVYLYFRFRMQH